MAADNASDPAAIWARAVTTWTEGWAALAGRPLNPDAAPADPFPLWNRAVDQWLEGWSAWFEQTLQTPEAAAASGRLLDTILNVEKPLRERTASTMQYWLEFWNMPSRKDLIRALTGLNDANARLDELQDRVEDLADQVASLGDPSGTRPRPSHAETVAGR